MGIPGGLRQLKKQHTRNAIATAALNLTMEKGLPKVTIEEIARMAFVSPRTVSNYFSCKEEAVAAAGIEDWSAVVAGLTRRPLDEAPLDSLSELLVDFTRSRTSQQLELNAQKVQLSLTYASLRPFELAQYEAFEEGLRTVVAARTGTDVDGDVYPWLVAAAVVSAVQSALRLWVGKGGRTLDLPQLIQCSLQQIRKGLPVPMDGERLS
jgi:AcrR family transcriptional regulator